MMFKIGDFARIGGVSVKTLHHYDDIGLLKPVHVDVATGYRYYALDQLPRLTRFPPESGVTVRELPEIATAASLVHRGSYDGVWQAYTCMLTWIEINGYRRSGPFRHINLRSPSVDEEPVTELLCPVEKRE